MHRISTVAVLILGLVSRPLSGAVTVGVNFVGGGIFTDPNLVLGTSEVAGFIPQQNWNNASGSSGSMSPEGDGGGGPSIHFSGFTLTWSAGSGLGEMPITVTDGNSRMMKGYLESIATGGGPPTGGTTVSVSGVPTALTGNGYAVIVYFDGGNGLDDAVTQIKLSATFYGAWTLYGLDKAGADFSGTFKQVPASSTADLGSATPAGNFVMFTGVRDSSFTLTVAPASSTGTRLAALNGVQLVDMRLLPTPPAPLITSPNTATGVVNVAFSYTITAINGTSSFGATGLPAGLSVNPANGVISGTPTLPGTYSITLGATNSAGSGTQTLTLTIGTGFSANLGNTGTTNQLSSGSLIDVYHGVVVGVYGTLLTTTNGGQTWGLINLGLTNTLLSVRGFGAYEFVTGVGGLIAWSRDWGMTWTSFQLNVTNTFYSLSFLTPFWGYAVGSGGIICFWNGAQWVPQSSGVTVDLFGVYAIGSVAYAVGGGGTICRFDGINWVVLNTGTTTVTFYDVAFLNENFGYAVGAGGAIYQTTNGGTNWIALNSGTGVTLRGIRIADLNTAWAVGDNGVILQTTDGGAHWTSISLGTLVNWRAIDFVNGRGIIVGDGGTAYIFQQGGYFVNLSPVISLQAPANGATFLPCSKIPLYASAYDVDGFVRKVELFLGPTKLAENPGNYCGYVWTNRTSLGTYTCVAKATDNLGATAYSAPVTFTVSLPPTDQLRVLGVVPTNAFEFCLCGVTGRVYAVSTSSNLASWAFWQTVTNQTGVVPIVEGGVSNHARRFYRAVRQ